MIRFGYYNAAWDWWFEVDDVVVECVTGGGGEPDIAVSPDALDQTQSPNQITEDTLTIANVGDAPLVWAIGEEPLGGLSPRAPEALGATTGAATEDVGAAVPVVPMAPSGKTERFVPQDVLYENGPLVTCAGCGASGADASEVQTSLGLSTYGFGHAVSSGFRVADDFTVDSPDGWQVETFTFYAYQTGSTTTSTFTDVNYRIWDGPPSDPASMVLFGDTTTNRLINSAWSGIYRTLDTTLTNTDRPIMANTVSAGVFLPAGTYWLDWQSAGTLGSGPWAPPVSIEGQTTTGNALQYDGAGWNPLIDTGANAQQDLPFIVEGTVAGGGGGGDCSMLQDVPWLEEVPNNGTTAGGESDDVTVIYNSNGLSEGTYEANLCVLSNDADEPVVIVPVMLTVQGQAEGPAIDLEKTVGLDDTCATGDTITAEPGQQVTYCYTVTNTGEVTFTAHDLEDSELGTLLDNFILELAPGDSVAITETTRIYEDTTNIATWTAYSSLGGYAVDDTIAYDFQDISGSGQSVTLADDEVSGALALGFGFDFYNSSYSDVYISSNGFITFLPGQSNGCCTGQVIPDPFDPNGIVAAWWEDLNPSAGGAIYFDVLGTSPNQVAIVQFSDVPHFGGSNNVTFQIKLYEADGVIEVHYEAAPSDGGTHAAGVENQNGTEGVQYYLGNSGLNTPIAVRYTPDVAESASDVDSATVMVEGPDIEVAPSNLSVSLGTDDQTTESLIIANMGNEPLVWNIDEALGGTRPLESVTVQPMGDPAASSAGPAPIPAKPSAGGPRVNRSVGGGAPVFGMEYFNAAMVSFTTDAPENLNFIAGNTRQFFAGDFVNGDFSTLYELDYDTNQLYAVDTTSGAQTLIGSSAPQGGETWSGAAGAPSGTFYGAATSCAGSSSIYTIDLATGQATRIGSVPDAGCLIEIAVNAAGDMYGWDIVTDSLMQH